MNLEYVEMCEAERNMVVQPQWKVGIEASQQLLTDFAEQLTRFASVQGRGEQDLEERRGDSGEKGNGEGEPSMSPLCIHSAAGVQSLLDDIAVRDQRYHSFTRFLPTRAKADAVFAEALHAAPGQAGVLCGLPFAVKDLYDVAGETTTAGAAMRIGQPPATHDAEVIRRLCAAGAVLVGTTNMDEYAYGFATVNAHFGTTCNPHDPDRLTGGSSGGSAAAVAARLVPFALGSDTNGSIRVPASLCGIYGLRPSHGTVPLDGVFPFINRLDVAGPFAVSLPVLKAVYETIACTTMAPVEAARLRIARLGGWFARNRPKEVDSAIDAIVDRFGQPQVVELPEAECSRAAAFVTTAIEGSFLHRRELYERPQDFDPAVRDRLLAGLLQPASTLLNAHRFADWFRMEMAKLWDQVDVLLAPATPCVAPQIDQQTIKIDGRPVSARAYLGIHTQPLGLAGCPVLAAPLWRPGKLPIGIQLIAAPGREDFLFALAAELETAGMIGSHPPSER